jgi:hypothetical protein
MKISYYIFSKHILFITLFLCVTQINAQNNRVFDRNSIGWYNVFGTVKLNQKFGVHTEYQWRRINFGDSWQQSLMRLGVNYTPNQRVLFRIGYGWIETFNYGDYPLNSMGKNFTEHRLFQVMQLNHKEGRFDFSHRFMLEQRFVGRYSDSSLTKEDQFPMLNRIRYMFRVQIPLKGLEMKDKTPFLAIYDELFIGFGKNVNVNVYDQNRFGAVVGYQFNKSVRIEGGFLHQGVQFGRLINGKNLFQYNNGIIVNAYFTLHRKIKPKVTN